MNSLKKRFADIDNRIDSLETSLHQEASGTDSIIRALKYRFWQFNNATNTMLYRLILQGCTKKQNFHPLVSIIMPVYNGEAFLENAISCALAQTYDNIEILIIDDGSTDNTAQIAKKYNQKIQYYKKPNGGVSSALNYGIKKMHGEYFSWLSHDDLITPDHIKNLVEWVSYEEHDNDIPFTSFNLVDEKGHILLDDTINAQIFCNDFKLSYTKNDLSLLQGEINGGSVLIPKSAFKECGLFDEKLKISQERDLWARLIQKYHFVNIPFDTASIRTHSSQVTNTNPDVAKKSNEKNLEIINNLSAKRILNLYDSEITFYENLKYFYDVNGKVSLSQEIAKKLDEAKNHA